jgi:hypothetical protein
MGESMEKNVIKAGYIVIASLAICIMALVGMGDLTLSSESAVSGFLPDQVGELPGEEVYYCQSQTCRAVFPEHELHDQHQSCPICGEDLDMRMIAEKSSLPKDTEIYRKRYSLSHGADITVQVVLSGKSRTSFHRPQHCLRMSGFVVEDTYTQTVALPGRDPLKVVTLTLIPPAGSNVPSGGAPVRLSYTYWYVGPGHETPSLWKRTALMAWDNAVHRTSHRWAYIGVMMVKQLPPDEHDQFIVTFLQDLYPSL